MTASMPPRLFCAVDLVTYVVMSSFHVGRSSLYKIEILRRLALDLIVQSRHTAAAGSRVNAHIRGVCDFVLLG